MVTPLVATGRIPLIGPMKHAEAMAQQGRLSLAEIQDSEDNECAATNNANLWTFLIPLIALVGFSVYFDIDLLKGIVATLAVTIPLMILQNLISGKAALDAVMNGFKIMFPPLATVICAFMFKSINDQLGMPQYVIESLQPLMSPLMLPLMTFLIMSMLAFATGSSWGIFAIAIPIFMPLAATMDVSPALMIGALLSASSFGSHACFYSDSTVLVAQSSGAGVMEHALSQLPYALISAVIAALLFVLISL